MPDTETSTEEPTGTVEAQETEEEPAASTDATSTEATGEETEAQPKIDWRELIRDVPPEEILKEHEALRKFHEGKAGNDAQRLAREKYLPEALAKERDALVTQVREQETARLAREERERRLDRALDLVQDDPETGASELRKIREEEKNEEASRITEQNVRQLVTDAYTRGNTDFDVQILRPLFQILHEDDRPKINGKDYGQGPQARIKYITDILELREARAAAEAVAKAKAEWDADKDKVLAKDREAIRKDVLGEVNGGQKVDTGSGVAGGAGPSITEIMSWPTEQRLEFKRTNPQAYNRAVMNGASK